MLKAEIILADIERIGKLIALIYHSDNNDFADNRLLDLLKRAALISNYWKFKRFTMRLLRTRIVSPKEFIKF